MRVLPTNIEFNYYGEKKVYDYLNDKLPEEWIGYFNYVVKGKEFDYLILIPNRGMVLIEVKGWEKYYDINVKDIDNIEINYDGKVQILKSPFKQARSYVFALTDFIKEKLDKNYLIVPLVCYPFLDENKFQYFELNKVSDRNCTLLEEDLNGNLEEIILKKFEQYENNNVSEFTIDAMYKVRSLFETSETLSTYTPNNQSIQNIDSDYSKLVCFTDDSNFKYIEKLSNELIDKWKKGTKIYFISNKLEIINSVKQKLDEIIQETQNGHFSLYNFEDFKLKNKDGVYKDSIFNFNFYLCEKLKKGINIEITDGKDLDKFKKLLTDIDKYSNFNIHQYKLEHVNINSDILVKAGAGSGKTYSMISRIMYLIYKNRYTADDLKEKIIMITFTNEATRNMKDRLRKTFMNYYMLTRNYKYYKLMEAVDEMKISTIHSLAKRIIQKYGYLIGIGNNFNISSGLYEKRMVIDEEIDFYLNDDNGKFRKTLLENEITLYEFKKIIEAIIEKLENKNIEVSNINLDFGNCSIDEFTNFIPEIISKTQNRLKEINYSNNEVCLSHLIIFLRKIIENLNEENKKNIIEYVFVDEFQDTDDYQIDLLNQFKKLFKFKLFVVGDVKQCIYRFRGAEDKAFDKLIMDKNFVELSLNKNYRTDKKLLKKLDIVFGRLKSKGLLEYSSNDKLIGTKTYNLKDSEYLQKIEIQNYEEFKQELIKILKKFIEEKEEVAILVRENKHIEEIRKICEEYDIDIETDIGGDLYQITPTIELYKLVKALSNPKDPKTLFELSNTSYSIDNYDFMEIFNNSRSTKVDIDNYIVDNFPICKFNEYVNELKYKPVLYVIRKIVFDLKPWDNYAKQIECNSEEASRRKTYYKNNLEQLIEKMITSFDMDYVTINKILKYLEINILTSQTQNKRESYKNMDTSNIKCMTVHKSKGLEFENVILPICNFEIDIKKSKGLVDVVIYNNQVGHEANIYKKVNSKNINFKNDKYENIKKEEFRERQREESRILYVAMTRPIKRLIYFYDLSSKSRVSWQHFINEVK